MTVRAFAPAKINLTLHVTGQRDDGYHLLDSLVVFADVGDEVRIAEAAGLTLDVCGPEAAQVPTGNSNSVLQATRSLGQDGLVISLEKRLPTAAGIGGGTSDAAAILRAISDLRGIPLPKDVLQLGADLPVCMQGCATRMSGVGEVLEAVPNLPEIPAVLVNPRVAVSTPAVFKQLNHKSNPPMPEHIPAFATTQELALWLAGQRNDLQAAAIELQPEIASVLTVLEGIKGQLLVRMSGSGATCFALFDTAEMARSAAQDIQNAHPDWWVKDTRLS